MVVGLGRRAVRIELHQHLFVFIWLGRKQIKQAYRLSTHFHQHTRRTVFHAFSSPLYLGSRRPLECDTLQCE
jgi:hypothetical protein